MKIVAVLLVAFAPIWCAPFQDSEDTDLTNGDGVHSHTDPYREGKMENNKFVLGDISVAGQAEGKQVSIGSKVNIQMNTNSLGDVQSPLEECLDLCQSNSCQNDRNIREGCNQMFSCAHGCKLRQLGVGKGVCRDLCDRNGQSGCSPNVSGWEFDLCRECNRGGCTKWPQVEECDQGCNFYKAGSQHYDDGDHEDPHRHLHDPQDHLHDLHDHLHDSHDHHHHGAAADPVKMPNIQYQFKGYDIMKGNPVQASSKIEEPQNHEHGIPIDLGYRRDIFNPSYNDKSVTPDGRYFQPDGTEITDCTGNCKLSFKSTEISGMTKYQESLEAKVSLNVKAWKAKFSASTDYKSVKEITSNKSSLFTLTSAICCSYKTVMEPYTPPSFHPDFLAGVKSLPDNYSEKDYQGFIDTFGTHFVNTALMGSLFGQQSQVSINAWTTMMKNGVKISAAAEYSGLIAGVGGSANLTANQTKWAEAFKESSIQNTFSVGALPPSDGKISTWIQEAKTAPAPMQIELASILNLFDDQYKLDVSDRVKINMKTALDGYCESLVNSGVVKSCTSPDPDPAFPLPRTWLPWSNDNHDDPGGLMPVRACDEGEYVISTTWIQKRSYFIVNLYFTCSDGKVYNMIEGQDPNYGTPDQPIKCDKKAGGIRQMTGMQALKHGIINIKAFCLNEQIEKTSNENLSGTWDQTNKCRDGQRIVGFQIRQQKFVGTSNFRFECA